MTNLTDPIFNDEDKAREHLESIRWEHGVYCPHCGNMDGETIHRLKGKSTRPGLFQCNACRQHFTVTVGTVMERSKIPLAKWVLGFHLYAASKKGISAHQLHRMLGVTYKTAWFMAHRIREAMKEDVKSAGPLGGEGKTVEADETYIGKRDTPYVSPQRKGRPFTKKGKGGGAQKRTVVSLVERGGNVVLPVTEPKGYHPDLEIADLIAYMVRRYLYAHSIRRHTELPLERLGPIFWSVFTGPVVVTTSSTSFPWDRVKQYKAV